MKVQATVLLLCFLCGNFLSYVVHAKPSPALMKELIALEKYLEKKQGSDGGDGQDKNQNGKQISDNELGSLEQNNGQIETTDKGQDKSVYENSNNVGEANNDGQDATDENQEPDKAVPPGKPKESVNPLTPEESVTPKKPDESVTSENTEVVLASSGGVKDGDKPQEGNGPNQSEGQEETGREKAAASLNQERSVLNVVDQKLKDTAGKYEAEFEKDDRKYNELKAKYQQLKDELNEKLDQVNILLEQVKVKSNSDEKESVKENAPARRSHLSDTEFLNIVHSLLTNN